MGRGQLLYVVLLWWLVVGNFERALVRFAPQRLVTEGVIGAVGLACTLLVLAWTPQTRKAPPLGGGRRKSVAGPDARRRACWPRPLSIVIDWAVVRAIYGDRFAGHASNHIRFGPRRRSIVRTRGDASAIVVMRADGQPVGLADAQGIESSGTWRRPAGTSEK